VFTSSAIAYEVSELRINSPLYAQPEKISICGKSITWGCLVFVDAGIFQHPVWSCEGDSGTGSGKQRAGRSESFQPTIFSPAVDYASGGSVNRRWLAVTLCQYSAGDAEQSATRRF